MAKKPASKGMPFGKNDDKKLNPFGKGAMKPKGGKGGAKGKMAPPFGKKG